jgi:hypothetical protein
MKTTREEQAYMKISQILAADTAYVYASILYS